MGIEYFLSYLILVCLMILALVICSILYDPYHKKISVPLIICFLFINIEFYYRFAIAICTLDSDALLNYSIESVKLIISPSYNFLILTLFVFFQTLAFNFEISFCTEYKRLIMYLQIFYLVLELPKYDDFLFLIILFEVLLIQLQVYIEYFEFSMEIELGLVGFLTGFGNFWIKDLEIMAIFSFLAEFILWPGICISFFFVYVFSNFWFLKSIKEKFVKICSSHVEDGRNKILWIFFDGTKNIGKMYARIGIMVGVNASVFILSEYLLGGNYLVLTLSSLFGISELIGLIIIFDTYMDTLSIVLTSSVITFACLSLSYFNFCR